jgi:hypothetical protein
MNETRGQPFYREISAMLCGFQVTVCSWHNSRHRATGGRSLICPGEPRLHTGPCRVLLYVWKNYLNSVTSETGAASWTEYSTVDCLNEARGKRFVFCSRSVFYTPRESWIRD